MPFDSTPVRPILSRRCGLTLTQKEAEMSYRVVYGETMPAWERSFSTLREAKAFAKKHESFGDVIFSISKVVPGEAPRSLTAMLSAVGR